MRAIMAVALLLAAGPAEAHAFLKTAIPAVGSRVTQPPEQVVLDFTEAVEPRFSSLTVQNAAGDRVDTGAVQAAGSATHLAIRLKALPPGAYTVTWHATSVDTHKTEGQFGFTVAP